MNALEQATELQEKAISILLAERENIDQRLYQLGHGVGELSQSIGKRRGRPRKTEEEKAPE